jgi:hypothetical protein
MGKPWVNFDAVYFLLAEFISLPRKDIQAMTAENTSQALDLNEETRTIWDQNAAFYFYPSVRTLLNMLLFFVLFFLSPLQKVL